MQPTILDHTPRASFAVPLVPISRSPHVPVTHAVREFHDRVSAAAGAVAAQNTERLRCARGCSACCVDGLTVFRVEAERIADEFAAVLSAEPHPEGACAFLDSHGACRVYEARPYVCRTQGLPLRWFEETDEGVAELRDICDLNDDGALASLPAAACWLIGPAEGELAALQSSEYGTLDRVLLRDLFRQDRGRAGTSGHTR